MSLEERNHRARAGPGYVRRRPPPIDAVTAPFRRRMRSIQIGSDKLIWGSDGRHELYDMARDPGEYRNRIDAEPVLARTLAAELEAWMERFNRLGAAPPFQPPPLELDADAEERLRSLGYIR